MTLEEVVEIRERLEASKQEVVNIDVKTTSRKGDCRNTIWLLNADRWLALCDAYETERALADELVKALRHSIKRLPRESLDVEFLERYNGALDKYEEARRDV